MNSERRGRLSEPQATFRHEQHNQGKTASRPFASLSQAAKAQRGTEKAASRPLSGLAQGRKGRKGERANRDRRSGQAPDYL